LRRNGADLVGLFIVPLGVALLPWSLGFALLKKLAHRPWPFHAEADAAWRIAGPHMRELGEEEWKCRFRLIRWVERTDTYLTLLRSRAWWRRHVRMQGEWPSGELACVLLTYHWGAGHWVWKLFRAQRIRAYFLARRPVVRDFGAGRFAAWYGTLRMWGLRCIGSLGPLYTGGSSEHVSHALARGNSIVAMLDLPTHGSKRAQAVSLLGRTIELPNGVVRLAESTGARVVLFSCGLDYVDGSRDLRVVTLPESTDAKTVMARYAEHLDERLHRSPEAWQMWHEAGGAFAVRDS
jgi:phosphatidylinositol dimannoside acyltransferase